MLSLRLTLALTLCVIVVAAHNAPEVPEVDYSDNIREYAQHHAHDAAHKYKERINKIDMLDIDKHPEDEDYGDEDDDDEEEEDYDDDEEGEDEDEEGEDDDDSEGGGCGGGDDDEDEDEKLTPVQEVIEEFFTR